MTYPDILLPLLAPEWPAASAPSWSACLELPGNSRLVAGAECPHANLAGFLHALQRSKERREGLAAGKALMTTALAHCGVLTRVTDSSMTTVQRFRAFVGRLDNASVVSGGVLQLRVELGSSRRREQALRADVLLEPSHLGSHLLEGEGATWAMQQLCGVALKELSLACKDHFVRLRAPVTLALKRRTDASTPRYLSQAFNKAMLKEEWRLVTWKR